MERDRVMLLTPVGMGAIAVVRLEGAGVLKFLQFHFSKTVREDRCVHGNITDGDRVIDDAVVVLLRGGNAADVNLHGGTWIVSSFLDLAARERFEVVNQLEQMVEGETEIEREVLAAVPRAKTREALAILLDQERAWEVYLRNPQAGPRPEQVLADRSLWWLLHPPRVAIVGAPNVGKSTLANQLFAQERSITADMPGTTRDWVGEEANLDGLVVTLVDTPGVREATDAIEREAIGHSAVEVGRADQVVVVLDGSAQRNDSLLSKHPDALPVINKIDRALPWVDQFAGAIKTIANTGQGVPKLRMAVRARFGCEDLSVGRPRWWTQRQRDLLSSMLASRQVS